MAATAETLEQHAHEYGSNIIEVQFTSPNYARPPELEIYGRSLSTIRRLGAFMIDKASSEAIINSPEAAQVKVEFYTSVEEGFGTDMELGGGLEVRDFDTRPVIDGRVMAKDLKTPISAMTDAGLKCAKEKVKREVKAGDWRFMPQLVRSECDHDNALIVDKMARGETAYNTRIVVSPFPEEAAAQSGNEYWRQIGYVPHLKRGFVQVYHAANGELISGSLSFDGSNKQRLRELFAQFGIKIPANEGTDNWLKYAITGNLSEDEAKALATAIADQAADPLYKKTTNTVDVTKQYKPIMDRVFNESYIHMCESLARGRQTFEAQKLIDQLAGKARSFNERYATALYRMTRDRGHFTDDDSVVLHELLVYSTIEMMRALHLEKVAVQQDPAYHSTHLTGVHLQAVDPMLFQNMLSGFGADGAEHNRTYSACGLAISVGENEEDNIDGNAANRNPQTAYGGVDGKGEESAGSDQFGSLQFSCPNPKCRKTNTRQPGKLLPNCRYCGHDVSCGHKTTRKDTGRRQEPTATPKPHPRVLSFFREEAKEAA